MSIMDKLFGTTPAPATPAPVQAAGTGNPGNIPATSANAAQPGSGVVPAGSAAPVDPNASPLDAFKDLWQAPTKPEGAGEAPASFFNVDPQKLMESAKKVDFAKVVTPEQLQAITAGGEGAAKAFAEALNAVSQATFANSAMATTKIVEAALAKAEAGYDQKIPGIIKKYQVSDTLRQENPVFNHPATQPIIAAIEHQLTLKNPNASASEIATQAREYMTQFASSLTPKKEEAAAGGKGEVDWESFLS